MACLDGHFHFPIGRGYGLAPHRSTIIALPVLTASLCAPFALRLLALHDGSLCRGCHPSLAGPLSLFDQGPRTESAGARSGTPVHGRGNAPQPFAGGGLLCYTICMTDAMVPPREAELTTKPKLRHVEAHPIQHQGQAMVLLRDPLQLSDASIAIPRPLAPLLGLMDGTRDSAGLEAALQVRAGLLLAPGLLAKLLADLDHAYLLDNERYASAREGLLRAYREAPSRPASLAGTGYPPEPEQAAAYLQAYVDGLPPGGPEQGAGPIRGLVSPHIDYGRGGPVYAEVWAAAAGAVRDADLVIVLGTDHQGSAGTLTLTRQSYATPWGLLPTDEESVGALARALGEEQVFAEELHHRGEHSIELAAMWLHFVRNGEPVPLVPVLCGHFGDFVSGRADPGEHQPFVTAVTVLKDIMATRRTLIVAAADLAHMGPAFGDANGLDFVGQAQARNADGRLLQAVCNGNADAFFEQLKAEGDRRHVCGLPPIYLTLRLLQPSRGQAAGYDLCPADPQGMSFVSIAGATLW